MRWISGALLVACSNHAPPAPDVSSLPAPDLPSEIAADAAAIDAAHDAPLCRAAPIATAADCHIVPRCPAPPTAGAKLLVQVATCAFRGSDGSCTPQLLAACPGDHASASLMLDCAVAIDIDAWGLESGAVDFGFGAQELDAACQPTGPHYDGRGSVAAACCERTLDVHLPRTTVRIVVRSDWQ